MRARLDDGAASQPDATVVARPWRIRAGAGARAFQSSRLPYAADDVGRKHREATPRTTLLAAFANTQFYGDGMRIAPEADFGDGQLDVCRISTMNPVQLLLMFPTVYFGRHRLSPKVEYAKATRLLVETETPLEIYADGEFVCETPAEISVAAGALKVIRPAE